ncbi:MAG: trypsin-like serine protease [Micropepsaceae bacterium]
MTRLASALLLATTLTAPAHAVIILDSTYRAEGYKAAEALAAEPQFAAVFAFCDDETGEGCGNASGTWIGNDESHGYILTAAHNFDGGYGLDTYVYRSREGRYYKAAAIVVHPNYTRVVAAGEENEASLGFDVAIVTLTEPVTDAGDPPLLYAGVDEMGQTLTYVGYGSRGSAGAGQDENEPAGQIAAAAQGVIESVTALSLSAAGGADGNYIQVYLPGEDGSVENPFGGDVVEPVSKNAGLLGSGDSGGSAWIETDGVWSIAGVNGNGSGNAQYGDTSGFARVSGHIPWITGIFPDARTE